MKKNQILRFADWTLKLAIALIMVSFILTIGISIHWHFDKDYYANVYLENGFKAGMHTFNLKISDQELTNISLASLSRSNMFWLIFRTSILMGLGLYSLIVLSSIVKSIKDLETFYVQSIQSFNRLAILCAVTSFIALFNFEFAEEGINWHFTIPFRLLIATSICLVLREVFKEGLKLHEDSKSIV